MVKNLTGGNKAKGISRSKIGNRKNKLFKAPDYDAGDVIGKIIKGFGNGRFEAKCFAAGIIRDINCSAPRKIRVGINDLVIINILRDNKKTHEILGCIIHKYESEQYTELRTYDNEYIVANRLVRPDIIKILKYEKQNVISELFDDCVEFAPAPTPAHAHAHATNATVAVDNSTSMFGDIDLDDI